MQVRKLQEQLAALKEEGSSGMGKLQQDLSLLSTASAGQSQLSSQQVSRATHQDTRVSSCKHVFDSFCVSVC